MAEEQLRVLLVEDNPGDARLIEELLGEVRRARYDIEHVGTLGEGLEVAAPDRFDVVLLDLDLPDSSGDETVEAMVTAAIDVPIVVLTGRDEPETGTEAVQIGAQDYLVKGSVDGRTVARALRYAVERYGLVRELRRSREELRTREANFRNLITRFTEGIVVVDRAGEIQFYNPAARRMFAFGGADWLEGRLPSELEPWSRDPGELTVAVNEGDPLQLEVSTAEILWEGEPARLIIYRDVTRRTFLERRLRHAEKMEAVGELVGGVAHDFNNLLTGILGNARFLHDRLPEGSAERDDVAQVLELAERGANLVRRLQAFGRESPADPVVVELGDLVVKTAEMLDMVMGGDIAIELEIDDDPAPIRCVPDEIEQILMNLATNARDAMPEGGTLRFAVRRVGVSVDDERWPEAEARPHVLLEVSDTGEGMGDEARRRAFEPYFTTKEIGRGSGLGLASVFAAVEAHDGQIDLESRPGEGSRFSILFPVERRGEPASSGSSEIDAAKRFSDSEPDVDAGTILVVDDQLPVRRVTRRFLEREGFSVLEAGTGEEALEMLEQKGMAVALAVVDLVLPEMDGSELARRLLESNRSAEVLIMSGRPGEAVELGVDDGARKLPLITKPFTADQFLETVRSSLPADGDGGPEQTDEEHGIGDEGRPRITGRE